MWTEKDLQLGTERVQVQGIIAREVTGELEAREVDHLEAHMVRLLLRRIWGLLVLAELAVERSCLLQRVR